MRRRTYTKEIYALKKARALALLATDETLTSRILAQRLGVSRFLIDKWCKEAKANRDNAGRSI